MRTLSKREIEAYCGDYSQLLGVREVVFQEGKAKGTRAYEIKNGRDLQMTILADKCFAIPEMTFQGINAGFICKTGICGPEFYQEEGTRGFLRNFEAGFLTTCGLTYMGTPGEENGQKNGLHGPVSNTPMEHVSSHVEWKDDMAWITVTGQAREGHLFGPNMVIQKKITLNNMENKIWISDVVTNQDFEPAPLMLLYHFNMGYPMLDESCRIYTDFDQIETRDEASKKGLDTCTTFQKPMDGYEEEVFFRTMSDKERDEAYVLIHNQNLDMGVLIRFNPQVLPVLNQWSSPRSGDYALGIEPGTCHVGGRIRAREEGRLLFLEPNESRKFELEIEFIDHLTTNEKYCTFIK
ncbi:MAG: aldose 1-epimerase family protein [Lachnospiraceae bacterium]|nr:aldose 1-epimerase family protein [Lachnospiraceae bacterium]